MSALMVVPVLDRDLAFRLVASLEWWREQGGFVHLSGEHASVAEAWNRGRAEVLASMHDHLVLCSEAVVFHDGGRALAELLSENHLVSCGLHGWKLQGLHRTVLEAVGPFDTVFEPAYFEDTDYLYRMGLVGMPSPRENDLPGCVWRDLNTTVPEGDGHGGKLNPRAAELYGTQAARYVRKWGGPQGHETYRRPYDHLPLNYIGEP